MRRGEHCKRTRFPSLEAYCLHRQEPHVGPLRTGREAQQRHGHGVFAATAGDRQAVCSHVAHPPERFSSQAATTTTTTTAATAATTAAATTTTTAAAAAATQVADGTRARWRASNPAAARASAPPAGARDSAPLRAHCAPARGARGARANHLAAPAAGDHCSGAYCFTPLVHW